MIQAIRPVILITLLGLSFLQSSVQASEKTDTNKEVLIGLGILWGPLLTYCGAALTIDCIKHSPRVLQCNHKGLMFSDLVKNRKTGTFDQQPIFIPWEAITKIDAHSNGIDVIIEFLNRENGKVEQRRIMSLLYNVSTEKCAQILKNFHRVFKDREASSSEAAPTPVVLRSLPPPLAFWTLLTVGSLALTTWSYYSLISFIKTYLRKT